MADIQQRYDKLKDLAEERLSMLSSYLPDVQRYESSRSAWESLLCEWEEKASTLPSHGATPQSIQAQMDEIKVCTSSEIRYLWPSLCFVSYGTCTY